MAANRNSYFYESRLERTGMSHALQIFFVYPVNNAQFNLSVKWRILQIQDGRQPKQLFLRVAIRTDRNVARAPNFFHISGQQCSILFQCKNGGFYKSKMAASRNSYFY